MAVDAYLLIDGIKGESLDDAHKDEIEVSSFSFGVSQIGTGVGTAGGQSGGRADFQDFSFSKPLDASSPSLYLACAEGKVHPKATLTCCRAGGDRLDFFVVEMEDVMITNVSPSGSGGGGDVPYESVTMGYGKITWTYTQQDPTTGGASGDVSAGWDLKINKKI